MNDYDTGKMRALLAKDGWTTTDDASEADLVLVNTCSIREKAVDKMHSALGEFRRMKKQGQPLTIGIAGCVAQERGDELMAKYKDIDLVFGPDHISKISSMVDAARSGERVQDTEFLDLANYAFVADVDPTAHGVSAFVTIQKGCDNKCTFCIVPQTRGDELSRLHGDIVAETRALVGRGVKEITLIGQNVNSYGLKQAGEITFAQLLYKVADVPGVERIRYTTSHPRDMGDDLIQAYRDLPQLTSHLHLPVQSGSNKILRRMKRYYTREHFMRVINALRDARPDFVLSTDIIVGFPDETEEDFEETMTLMEEAQFMASFSFKYSQRPGTPALRIKNQVPNSVAGARLTRFQNRQRERSQIYHSNLVGDVVNVMIEGPSRHDEGVICGRTGTHVMVNFPGRLAEIGKFMDVRITRGFTHSCRGERVE
ncbi:MAG: tRNA (N6-isopentenyl adenosine(37)-C2)-methylthiotransferase MiaB [Rhodobacterales bacterium]|nr:tRNA (N6-isopentenyl adenosine(37)-C2)-methylthiotransferase MiaB [Rhodobacterales bacterium]